MGDLSSAVDYVFGRISDFDFSSEEAYFIGDGFVKIAEMPDNERTALHSVGVDERLKVFGPMLGLSEKVCFVDAVLHDIGKIYSPELYSFCGEFDADQHEQKRAHPIHSAEILTQIFPENAIHALCHHALGEVGYYPSFSRELFSGDKGKVRYLHTFALAIADYDEAMTSRNDTGRKYDAKLAGFFARYPHQWGLIEKFRAAMAA